MNKKFAIAAIITTLAAVGAYWFSVLSSEIALFERYPDLPQEVVVKAHRIMVKRTYAGRYNDIDLSTDEACDAVFQDIVKEITK